MSSDPKVRMPYGPGWEDPDWSPHAEPPAESAAMKLTQGEDARPVVSTFAQFMAIVKRHASPRAPAPRPALPAAAQTRRWVMAGSAGLVALATLPGGRAQNGGPADERTKSELREVLRQGETGAGRSNAKD